MKLVTIVCEALVREPLVALLRDCGAHGYTLSTVEGFGANGTRLGDIAEFANVRVEVVSAPDRAEILMRRLQEEFLPKYGVIVFESDVRVLRADKF